MDDLICVGYEGPNNATVETVQQKVERELKNFLQYPIDPAVLKSPTFDVLKWWRKNHPMYPLLSKFAQRIICVPATSTPSERVFSTAGNIVTKNRSMLKPENVDKLIFLHSNYGKV